MINVRQTLGLFALFGLMAAGCEAGPGVEPPAQPGLDSGIAASTGGKAGSAATGGTGGAAFAGTGGAGGSGGAVAGGTGGSAGAATGGTGGVPVADAGGIAVDAMIVDGACSADSGEDCGVEEKQSTSK